ncbi:hypothetical protein VNO77_03055 [Canavalia gladiata]|uniref:Uncharacterized protein n=1 Tax=Canavalia gladiata TaxID=3824 RepID=A0AAN9MU37_CANGL
MIKKGFGYHRRAHCRAIAALLAFISNLYSKSIKLIVRVTMGVVLNFPKPTLFFSSFPIQAPEDQTQDARDAGHMLNHWTTLKKFRLNSPPGHHFLCCYGQCQKAQDLFMLGPAAGGNSGSNLAPLTCLQALQPAKPIFSLVIALFTIMLCGLLSYPIRDSEPGLLHGHPSEASNPNEDNPKFDPELVPFPLFLPCLSPWPDPWTGSTKLMAPYNECSITKILSQP